MERFRSVSSGFAIAVAKTNWLCDEAPVLHTNESAALTLDRPKTCALLYDKIWGGTSWWTTGIPSELVFGCRTTEESQAMIALCMTVAETVYDEVPAEKLSRITEDFTLSDVRRTSPDLSLALDRICGVHEMSHGNPIRLLPGMTSPATCREGSVEAATVLHVLDGLPFFDEEALSWEQVLEFRADAERKRDIRRFFRWIEKGFVGIEVAEIEDELGARLDRYREDLAAHGVQTKLVSLETLALASAAVVAAPFAPLSSIALAVAGVALSVAKGRHTVLKNRMDVRRKHEDIALAIKLQDLADGSSSQR